MFMQNFIKLKTAVCEGLHNE